MLATSLLQYHRDGDRVVPHYLTERDHPWLAELIEAFGAIDGQRLRDWRARKAVGWAQTAPEGKRGMALSVLEGLGKRRTRDSVVSPKEVRQAVFEAAERLRAEGRERVLSEAAAGLRLPVAEVEATLLADLGDERLVVAPAPLPDAGTLAERVNLELVQGLLARSVRVDVRLVGNARAVVRQVLLRRLIAVVQPADEGVRLEISGVFSLFRRTTVYGRALASIVPLLGWCDRFSLEAELSLGGRSAMLRLGPSDPIRRTPDLARYDSKLEARFARDLARKHPEWEFVREPEPVPVDGTLVFPDFEVRLRDDPERRALVEIVGFWTPDYLTRKLGRLARSGRGDLVLCVDADRCAEAAELAPDLPIVPFRRHVDVAAVLAAVGRSPRPVRTATVAIGDLFLDYAGRRPPTDPIHHRLEALAVGDPVELCNSRGGLQIAVDEVPVACLSRAGRARHQGAVGDRIAGRVERKLLRRADQSAPAWRGQLRCAQWWVPVVSYALG